MALFVQLRAVGNPDFGQGTDIGVPAKRVRVASPEAASRAVRAYIEEWDLGGGNWAGGQVFDAKGRQVAYVSYNGRVWTEQCDWPRSRR